MSHLGIFKLEDRVLFDAAGAAEVVEAASNVDNHSQVSESQVQDNEAKDALKNAPPENPADAAVQQQVQQAFPEYAVGADRLPLVIACHTGPDVYGMGFVEDLPLEG